MLQASFTKPLFASHVTAVGIKQTGHKKSCVQMSDGNSGASYICFYTSDRQNHTYAFFKKKKIF